MTTCISVLRLLLCYLLFWQSSYSSTRTDQLLYLCEMLWSVCCLWGSFGSQTFIVVFRVLFLFHEEISKFYLVSKYNRLLLFIEDGFHCQNIRHMMLWTEQLGLFLCLFNLVRDLQCLDIDLAFVRYTCICLHAYIAKINFDLGFVKQTLTIS